LLLLQARAGKGRERGVGKTGLECLLPSCYDCGGVVVVIEGGRERAKRWMKWGGRERRG